ncbi:hypothetical protein [Kordiimonas sp.]|uniref:hypothetical protein n=1 Tax=Kordiimonas sp. TaxID=1970157 RepID=UPI003A93B2C0
MLRFIILMLLCTPISFTAVAADEEERAALAFETFGAFVIQYADVRDEDQLRSIDRKVERIWQDFTRYHGTSSPLVPKFALIRARSATAARDEDRAVPLWLEAIKANAGSSPAFIMGLDIEAAQAAAKVGDIEQAKQFFASARAYAYVRGELADEARLQLRVMELQILGARMAWRDLNDALLDLREGSQRFPMWTLPRLESLLSEAEIRLDVAPEGREKREDLSRLKAQIILMQKGMSRNLPASLIMRIRTLYYALEDRYAL